MNIFSYNYNATKYPDLARVACGMNKFKVKVTVIKSRMCDSS